MVEVRETLNESHVATPAAVGIIRRAVADYARAAGAPEDTLDGIRLAVSEAVTNVVRHAYDEAQPGHVHVTARMLNGELLVLVADEGRGHSTPSERPGLGWGLALITDATDEFTLLARAEGGTEAQMRFSIPDASAELSSADR